MTDDDELNEQWLRIVREARDIAEQRGDAKPTREDYAAAREIIRKRLESKPPS